MRYRGTAKRAAGENPDDYHAHAVLVGDVDRLPVIRAAITGRREAALRRLEEAIRELDAMEAAVLNDLSVRGRVAARATEREEPDLPFRPLAVERLQHAARAQHLAEPEMRADRARPTTVLVPLSADPVV